MNRPSITQALGYGRRIFSEEHEAYRATARRFFQKEIEPNVRQWQRDGFFPAEVFTKAGRAGLLCAGFPPNTAAVAVIFCTTPFSTRRRVLSRWSGHGAGVCTDTASYVVLHGGTEAQKHEWLPQFASGDVISEVGVTEPHWGSDPRSIRPMRDV